MQIEFGLGLSLARTLWAKS